MTPDASKLAAEGGREFDELGDALMRVHEELCGERPDSAHCVLAGSVLSCVLTGGLTPIERTLIEHDRPGDARDYREAIIDAESEQLLAAVEAALGRKVASRVHVFEPAEAITTLVYVLQPATDHADQRRAILAWAEQVRNQSQRHRSQHTELRETQRRLAAEIEKTRTRSAGKR